MRPIIPVITAVLLVLGAAAAAYGLRCGTELVTEGDSKFEVLRACGEPIAIFREDDYGLYGRETLGGGDYDKWVYDIGGGVFHILYFDEFEVRKIEWIRQ